MNNYFLLLTILLWAVVLAAEYNERIPGAVSYQTYTRRFDHPKQTVTLTKEVPVPYPVHIEKRVPYPIKVPVAVPIDRPVPVHVPKPYPVPVVATIPYPVEKPIPYPVKVLQPVAVNQPLAVITKLPYTFSTSPYQPLQQHTAGQQQFFNQQYHQ